MYKYLHAFWPNAAFLYIRYIKCIEVMKHSGVYIFLISSLLVYSSSDEQNKTKMRNELKEWRETAEKKTTRTLKEKKKPRKLYITGAWQKEKKQHMTKMLNTHKEIAWVEHRQLIYALNENSARINKKLSVRLENTRTCRLSVCAIF